MVKGKETKRVEVFVDWENIRQRLSDNYVEKVSIVQVMEAFEKVANEIGELKQATFYGDFTLRRDEAREIERRPKFRIRNVLRSRSGRDQTDPVMITELTELIMTSRDFDSILLGSGDSDYCEVIRKANIKNIKAYICAVGRDASPDLTSLAPLYPIERFLNIQLTPKTLEQHSLSGLSPKDLARWTKLVTILDSVESRLPYVTRSYFLKTIMLSYGIGGQTSDDRWAFLESARENEIITIDTIDNPTRPGFKLATVKLNRDNPIVREILSRK